MPSASQYIIDVNNIRPSGNLVSTGIYVTNASGTRRESFYAVRGTGSSNVVIYDKVNYQLTVNDATNEEPNSHTVTFTYTSKRTHGNGTNDNLSIKATTYTVTANTSTSSTASKTVQVCQALTANGTTKGPCVNVTITQKKDYPSSITFTVPSSVNVSAAGGTFTSSNLISVSSVVATYKSGNSRTLGSSEYSVSFNPTSFTVARANGAGVTNIQTVTVTVSHTVNSVTVSASKSVTVKRNADSVSGYGTPTGLSVSCSGDIPASGGSKTASYGGTCSQTRTWVSGYSDTINPTCSVTWTNQTITAGGLGCTSKARTAVGTPKITYSANGKSNTAQCTVYQQANAITSTVWNNPDFYIGCGDIPAAGGSANIAIFNLSQTANRTWTSGCVDHPSNSSFTYTWGRQSGNTSISITGNSSGGTATKSTANNTGSTISAVAYLTVTGQSKSATSTCTVNQPAPTVHYYNMHVVMVLNSITITPYGNNNYNGFSIQCNDVDNSSDLREIESVSINATWGYNVIIGYPSWPYYPITFTGQSANTPQWGLGGETWTDIQFLPGTGKSTSCSFDVGQWYGDGFNWSTTSVTATFTLIDLGDNSTLGTTSCTGGWNSYPSNTMNLGTLAARDYSTKLLIDINFFLQPTS